MAHNRNTKPAISMVEYVSGNSLPKAERGSYKETPLDDSDYGLGFEYRGFFCKLNRTNGFWTIDVERSAVEVPDMLRGMFTGREILMRSIQDYFDNGRN